MSNQPGEDFLFYEPSETIFKRGDKSGNLLVIEEGDVEIFSETNGKEVILAKMGRGEVMGVTTYLTGEPRMASARAVGGVKVKVIQGSALRSALDKLPNWVKVVLKEFTQRLHKMNDAYSEAVAKTDDVDLPAYLRPPSRIQIANQFASFICSMAEILSQEMDETRGVLPLEMIETCSNALGYEKSLVDQVYSVFLEAGLLRLTQDPEKKRKYIKQSELEKVKSFCAFVTSTRLKKVRALVNSSLKQRELKFLGGLARYLQKSQPKQHEPVRVAFEQLEAEMEKLVGVTFDPAPLEAARSLGMLKLDSLKEASSMEVIPAELVRILVHLDAYKRLQKLDQELETKNK